jgi:putative transposase
MKTFGCCRFVYNYYLEERQAHYKQHGNMKGFKPAKTIKQLKADHDFLGEPEQTALQQELRNLDTAYNNHFTKLKKKQSSSLKFKNRYDRQSFRTMNSHGKDIRIDFPNRKVRIGKVGWLKFKDNRVFTGTIKSATISRNTTGKFYISILTEEQQITLPTSTKQVGIDLGITTYATLSDGNKIDNPRILKQYEEKLAIEQQRLSKKKKGSNNYHKQQTKVAKVHEKITNVRKDFQQKLSTTIINENQVIVVEDLSVKNMVKNHCLAKAVSDCSWASFVKMLEYKAEWYGRTLIKIDRFFPSTKLCSCCHHKNDNLTLSDRIWSCEVCHTKHDRDINAAVNILTVGTTGSACAV